MVAPSPSVKVVLAIYYGENITPAGSLLRRIIVVLGLYLWGHHGTNQCRRSVKAQILHRLHK